MTKRVLLIDADVLAYQACSAVQQEIEFEPGYFTWHSSMDEVKAHFDNALDEIMGTLGGSDLKLCLTDSEGNFRKTILPTYKGKRGKKPLVLKAFKEYLINERQAFFRPGLEGDDCMGILATVKSPDERIIVSIDKDMMQIPGLFCRWPDEEILHIHPTSADKFHLMQTLTGDVTDGYSGCPGIGPKKAEAILDADLSWSAVVAAYEKAGLTEEDALVQARVARILRASDYNFKTKEPVLWEPLV